MQLPVSKEEAGVNSLKEKSWIHLITSLSSFHPFACIQLRRRKAKQGGGSKSAKSWRLSLNQSAFRKRGNNIAISSIKSFSMKILIRWKKVEKKSTNRLTWKKNIHTFTMTERNLREKRQKRGEVKKKSTEYKYDLTTLSFHPPRIEWFVKWPVLSALLRKGREGVGGGIMYMSPPPLHPSFHAHVKARLVYFFVVRAKAEHWWAKEAERKSLNDDFRFFAGGRRGAGAGAGAGGGERAREEERTISLGKKEEELRGQIWMVCSCSRMTAHRDHHKIFVECTADFFYLFLLCWSVFPPPMSFPPIFFSANN